jgi:ABC-type uncharacterized transport system permease subunit
VASRLLVDLSAAIGERRQERLVSGFAAGVASLLAALLLTALILLVLGANPLEAYQAIFIGSLGNLYNISQTVMVMAPLMLTGVAAAIPFAARQWNVGGEGQLYVGAVAAVLVALTFVSVPGPLLTLAALLGGIAAGAVWGLIAAGLKVLRGANEVIVTFMLNFIALLVADYVITGPWAQNAEPQTRSVPSGVDLAALWPGSNINLAPLIALAGILVAWVVMTRTSLGFGLRASGLNARAARLAGFGISRLILAAFALGGAWAGLAGGILVVGVHHALVPAISAQYGYTGIAVALIARLHPLWVIPSAALFAIIDVGGSSLPAVTGVSTSASYVIEAAFVILLLAFRVIRFTYPEAP